MSFFQLDHKVLKSSIYLFGTPTEWKVWTHLLLTASPRTGDVEAPVWLIARETNLSEDDVEAALKAFEAPDPRSRTKTDDGRRIVRDGDKIHLINYLDHRNKDHSTPRTKAWRERQERLGTVGNGTERSGTKNKNKNKNKNIEQTTTETTIAAPPPAAPPSTPAEFVRELTEATRPPLPWSSEACDDWIARFEGTAPGGTIGRHLRPLVDKHGWPAVRAAWKAYLAETESQFANPARFAATYGTWRRALPPPPEPPPEPLPAASQEAHDSFEAMKVRLSGVLPLQSHATWLRPVFGHSWEHGCTCLVLRVPSKEHAAQMRAWADRLRKAGEELGLGELTFRTIVVPYDMPALHDGSVR